MKRQPDSRTREQRPRGKRAKVPSADTLVFVVDDEPFLREALVEIVTGAGFPVVEADDGAVAIQLLRAGLRPSLILIDLSMRNMGGQAFRIEQTKDPALREIETVVLTGSPVDRKSLGRELDGVTVMAKPVDYDELLAVLGRHGAPAA